VRLSAAPHFSDQTTRVYRHARVGRRRSAFSIPSRGREEAVSRQCAAAAEQVNLKRIPRSREEPEITMAEEAAGEAKSESKDKNRDEIALELMKFIAVTTGYGKGGSGAGFGGKTARTPEEYADSLLQLFERCRAVVGK